jgi:hypothetical protein
LPILRSAWLSPRHSPAGKTVADLDPRSLAAQEVEALVTELVRDYAKEKITMAARPQNLPSPDKWLSAPGKRLTIDVPTSHHTRFKMLCAQHEIKMAAEINAFIARRIAELKRREKAS